MATLYANGASPTPAPPRRTRASFNERSAPARGRMAERRRQTRTQSQNAAQRRTRVSRGIRGVGRRSLRVGRTAHRAAGNPGGVLARIVGIFIGAGILVAVVRNPRVITTPLEFVAAASKAFTGLLAAGSGPPKQNVGTTAKGVS